MSLRASTQNRPFTGPHAGRSILLALAVALTAGALAGPSRAATLPGPTTLSTGFVDDAHFQAQSFGVRTLWWGRAAQLGPSRSSQSRGWVRLQAYWNVIAPQRLVRGFNQSNPGDPHYAFATLDAAIRSAAAAHQQVLILMAAAPVWAEGPGMPAGTTPGTWRPNATDFARFAHAVATRYSGHYPDPLRPGHSLPAVTYFQIWNEPNLQYFLSPQWSKGAHTYVPASPGIYRSLLNAGYRAIKAVQPRSFVLSAGTAPYGDPPSMDSRMTPVLFVRSLLCLRMQGTALAPEHCTQPAHLDALDHHPYSLTPTIHAFNPMDISVPDIGKLQKLLSAALHFHTVLPARPKPVWVTEINWGSNPPNPKAIPVAQQARYLSLAFYELWRQQVSHVFWYEMVDPNISVPGLSAQGVYYSNNTPKPSATAYHFPFVAVTRKPSPLLTLWGRAPSPGAVTVQVQSGTAWRTVARLNTTAGGILYDQIALSAVHGTTFRAVEGTTKSLPFLVGPQ